MTKITTLEAAVLDHIARNSYQPTNYSRPTSFSETSSIWRHSILDSSSEEKVEKRSLPGVCASLVKKGLISCVEDGNDSTIRLTESGYAAWDAAYPCVASEEKAREKARGMVEMPAEPTSNRPLTADEARRMFAAQDEAAANRTPAGYVPDSYVEEQMDAAAEQLAAEVPPSPVVPPVIKSVDVSLLRSEREQRLAQYTQLVRRLQEESQDLAQDVANGRAISTHPAISIGRLAADIQALASVLQLLDSAIQSAN